MTIIGILLSIFLGIIKMKVFLATSPVAHWPWLVIALPAALGIVWGIVSFALGAIMFRKMRDKFFDAGGRGGFPR